MYIEINNEALKEEIIESNLFKVCKYEYLENNDIDIQVRYTSDESLDDVLFSTEYWMEKNERSRFKNEISEFISILKNRKYHLDPECNDGLGVDITKNVNILITVRPEMCEPPEYFIFII